MVWVRLDDTFHSNPKIISLGLEGAGVYARALSYCGAYLTDGFVPKEWARALAGEEILEKLVALNAWDEVEGGYQIPHYLSVNPSKEKVLALAEEKSKAGKKGAETRWHRRKPKDGSSHPDDTSQSTSHGTSDSSSHLNSSSHGKSMARGREDPAPSSPLLGVEEGANVNEVSPPPDSRQADRAANEPELEPIPGVPHAWRIKKAEAS